MWRRGWWVLLAGLWTAVQAAALQVNGDLSALAERARARGVPVLMVFGASDCVYCRRLEREVLNPLLQAPAEARAVEVAEVHIDSEAPLVWLDGRRTSGSELAERYGVAFTPTVILFSPGGEPLGRPLVGYNPAFYEAYLEAAIEDARGRLAAP